MNKLATNRFFRPFSSLLKVLVFVAGVFFATAQTPGIPYQAYIIDTNAGYIPGEQIEVPLANAEIMLEFEVRNDVGEIEYVERIIATTDEFGMVSTVVGVGNGTPVQGNFEDIDWNGNTKKIHIDIDFSGTGNELNDHGVMDLVYIPGPGNSAGGPQTVTTLDDNGDGSYTYTNEDGTTTTFSVTQNGVGNPNTLGTAGNIGNIYVDRSSGHMYLHGGTQWINLSNGLSTGVGAPTATSPSSPSAGDIYVDESTGDIYTYNGTEWTRQPEAEVSVGTGVPTATDPASPSGGDIYIDESTGDVYTYNTTTNTWENQSEVVSTDADNIIVEGTDGLAYLSAAGIGLSTGVGAPTATSPSSPNAGDIYVDESTGDIYTYNGTEWVDNNAFKGLNYKTVNTSTYTLMASDDLIEYNGTVPSSFSLPTVAESANIPIGKQFFIVVSTFHPGQVSFDATNPQFLTISSNIIFAGSSGMIIHWGNGRYGLLNGF